MTETRRLKNAVIFIQTSLSFVLSRKIYDVLSSFRLYYVQVKEVKILWGPDMRAGGRITQTPNIMKHKASL